MATSHRRLWIPTTAALLALRWRERRCRLDHLLQMPRASRRRSGCLSRKGTEHDRHAGTRTAPLQRGNARGDGNRARRQSRRIREEVGSKATPMPNARRDWRRSPVRGGRTSRCPTPRPRPQQRQAPTAAVRGRRRRGEERERTPAAIKASEQKQGRGSFFSRPCSLLTASRRVALAGAAATALMGLPIGIRQPDQTARRRQRKGLFAKTWRHEQLGAQNAGQRLTGAFRAADWPRRLATANRSEFVTQPTLGSTERGGRRYGGTAVAIFISKGEPQCPTSS